VATCWLEAAGREQARRREGSLTAKLDTSRLAVALGTQGLQPGDFDGRAGITEGARRKQAENDEDAPGGGPGIEDSFPSPGLAGISSSSFSDHGSFLWTMDVRHHDL
jgi:hypothetical protein